jgi:hypothetical protein
VRSPLPVRLAVRFGALGFVCSLLLIGMNLVLVHVPGGNPPPCDQAFVRLYDPPQTKVETVLDVGDGQAYAALAVDPSISDPGMFCDGPRELTYRASRPLFGWMVWAGSLGQPALVPAVLFILISFGVGLFSFASVLLAAQYGRNPKLGALTLLLPGTIYCIIFLGPEPLAVGCAMLGLVFWRHQPKHAVWSVVFLTAAIMMRDILIVVPAVVVLHDLVISRQPLRKLLILAVPPAVYVAWVGWLYQRYHYLPSTADTPGRWENTAPPFRGIAQAFRSLEPSVFVGAALVLVFVVLALVRDKRSELTWCVLAWAAMSIVMGRGVWQLAILRVLLPLYAFGLIVALVPLDRPTTTRLSSPMD